MSMKVLGIPIERIKIQLHLFDGISQINMLLFVEGIYGLAEDIKHNGLKNPLSVTKDCSYNYYVICDGHHRLFALLVLGYHTIPCRIVAGSEEDWKYDI